MSYAGGKQLIAHRVIELIQPHDHYIEPFFGSGAVLFAKSPSRLETVNDLDDRLVNFWRVLRDRPEELAWACAMTPHSRQEFLLAHQSSHDALEQARRTWTLITQGRGGRAIRAGWRHVVTRTARQSLPSQLDGYITRLLDVAERLRNISIEHRDALELLTAYDAPGTCFYLDPPYLPATRRDGLYCREVTTSYHEDLLDALQRVTAQVILSAYPHPPSTPKPSPTGPSTQSQPEPAAAPHATKISGQTTPPPWQGGGTHFVSGRLARLARSLSR